MTDTTDTLEEAKKLLRANWETGVDCPCCGQFVKRYRRKLNSGMCVFLIELYRRSMRDQELPEWPPWIQATTVDALLFNRDYSKLKYWGLIEPKPTNREEGLPDKSSAGLWRITKLGIEFVRRHVKVKKYVFLYNQRYFGQDGEEVDIVESLGSKFNYVELMQGI